MQSKRHPLARNFAGGKRARHGRLFLPAWFGEREGSWPASVQSAHGRLQGISRIDVTLHVHYVQSPAEIMREIEAAFNQNHALSDNPQQQEQPR